MAGANGAPPHGVGGFPPEVDIERMIDKFGCAEAYYALEECLGDNDRDWRKCQRAVRALKDCSLAKCRARQEELRARAAGGGQRERGRGRGEQDEA